MKKLALLLFAAVLLLSFAGCSAGHDHKVQSDAPALPLRYGEQAFQTGNDAGASPAPLTDAPELTVSCAGQTITALGGPIYWEWDNGDGTRGCIKVDRLHPLAMEDLTPVLKPDEAGLTLLRWEETPDVYKVFRWSGDSWGNFEAEEERVTVNSLTVRLEPGYIYRVFASWDRETCKGTAEYQFQTA